MNSETSLQPFLCSVEGLVQVMKTFGVATEGAVAALDKGIANVRKMLPHLKDKGVRDSLAELLTQFAAETEALYQKARQERRTQRRRRTLRHIGD